MHSRNRSAQAASLQPWDVARAIVRPPLLAWLRPRITGLGHIPGSGGVLLAANHLSYLDIFLVACASPRTPRFIGKRELTTGLVGRAVQLCGMVPVDRGRGDVGPVLEVVDLLRGGSVVGIFPEGTRSRDGRLYQFRSGLARAAAAAAVPTVPVSITGTAQVWPRGGGPRLGLPAAGAVSIHFGAVVGPPDQTPASRRTFTQQVTAAVARGCGQPLADSFAALDD